MLKVTSSDVIVIVTDVASFDVTRDAGVASLSSGEEAVAAVEDDVEDDPPEEPGEAGSRVAGDVLEHISLGKLEQGWLLTELLINFST